jgi:hypothetical protein
LSRLVVVVPPSPRSNRFFSSPPVPVLIIQFQLGCPMNSSPIQLNILILSLRSNSDRPRPTYFFLPCESSWQWQRQLTPLLAGSCRESCTISQSRLRLGMYCRPRSDVSTRSSVLSSEMLSSTKSKKSHELSN